MTEHQRKFDRLDIELKSTYVLDDKTEGPQTARVLNLSPDGLCLSTPDQFIRGTVLSLTIKLPPAKTIDGDMTAEEDVVLSARSAWSLKDLFTNEYKTGFKILEPYPANFNLLLGVYNRLTHQSSMPPPESQNN
jgi:hypothetical protein